MTAALIAVMAVSALPIALESVVGAVTVSACAVVPNKDVVTPVVLAVSARLKAVALCSVMFEAAAVPSAVA